MVAVVGATVVFKNIAGAAAPVAIGLFTKP
jgi:hypothetical protein